MSASKFDELQARLEELNEASQTIIATADAENRQLSADEQKDLEVNLESFEEITAEIEKRKLLNSQTDALRRSAGRQTDPDPLPNNNPEPAPRRNLQTDNLPRVPASPRGVDAGRWGFRNLGEFCLAVRHSSASGAVADPRLQQLATPSTYGSEGIGADGGFAVPPDFRNAIMLKVMGEESLLARTDQMTSSSNSITIPTDTTTPWGTTGIQAYWEGEGALKTQSKPALEANTVRLNKVIALVPVTDELLEDGPALETYIKRKAPDMINFKVSLAIVQGTGVGQPLGILNSAGTVSVAQEGSQAADTIVYANIVKMWSRLYAPSRPRSVWLINQDIEPSLLSMAFVAGAASPVPAYMPAGGLSASPYATLMGRPVIPTQAMETLGDKGDILLADLSQYLTVTKVGGMRSDVSIHLWFDYDITAFRFVLRVGGQPWWNAPVSPRDGSNTLGVFVTLDERPG